jgi:hypothetical protein
MSFARTWGKVPFMRFGSTMTKKEGTAARGNRRQPGRLDSGLGGETRACQLGHGSLVLIERPGFAATIGRSATPANLVADLDPAWSHLSSLAWSRVSDTPQAALPLMPAPTPPPTRKGQTVNRASFTLCWIATAARWSEVSAGRWPTLTQDAISRFMSGSFVHRSIIAGCRCFSSRLPSGPHEEGRHATQ